ncbi:MULTISPECIES: hypothetical protein [unclassified Paenibacillus]|uniref:hypothetical protein n=1 Tax=unclassified Paenibacillus TaxID=185978 RepID=UPI000838D34D|nr:MULTISPECIES: hypothetical protein [unclassified Paenibacillus]NWL86237.1 hypothetical protein [Paenibacillus sp. 79R4]
MLYSVIILGVTSLIIRFDVPSLVKSKYTKELWVFSILLLIGITMNVIANVLQNVPTPLKALTFILDPLNHLLENIGLIQTER